MDFPTRTQLVAYMFPAASVWLKSRHSDAHSWSRWPNDATAAANYIWSNQMFDSLNRNNIYVRCTLYVLDLWSAETQSVENIQNGTNDSIWKTMDENCSNNFAHSHWRLQFIFDFFFLLDSSAYIGSVLTTDESKRSFSLTQFGANYQNAISCLNSKSNNSLTTCVCTFDWFVQLIRNLCVIGLETVQHAAHRMRILILFSSHSRDFSRIHLHSRVEFELRTQSPISICLSHSLTLL